MEPRIGDREREAATSLLGDHYAQGRLDHEEYDERLDAVWSARTPADLDALFWDLPRAVPAAPPAATAQPQRRSRTPRIPQGVILLVIGVLITVAVVKAAPWVLLIAALWFFFLRPGSCSTHRRQAHHH